MKNNTLAKRFAASLLLLVICIMPAFAEDYGIMIGGVKVTSDNASNISGSASNITGTVKYDKNTCTLTLQNATVDCQNNNGMRFTGSFSYDLRINLVGTNTFKNVNGVGIYAKLGTYSSTYKRVKFIGTGSLEVPASICVDGNTNVIDVTESCTVKCTYCYSNVGGTLYVSNGATLHLYQGSSYAGTINGFNNFYTIDGPEILIPEGAKYNISNKHLVDASGKRVDGEVKIAPRDYGITVGGVKVTSANKGNVTGDAIYNGTVSYNSNTNTLYLNNASIDASGYGIHNEVDGLRIYFSGDCSVEGSFPIDLEANTTMTGTSSSIVRLYASNSPIWVGKDVNLTIENIRVVTRGATSSGAIRGYGSNSTLKFKSANVDILQTGSNPCVKGITDCILEDDEAVAGAFACYRKSLKGFGTTTELTTGSMYIEKPTETYPIEVFGHQLNDVNTRNWICYEDFSGMVRYDKLLNRLVLEDVTADISDEDTPCIRSTDTRDIILGIFGTNNLSCKYYAGISLKSPYVRFQGTGTLNLNGAICNASSSAECDLDIYCNINATYIEGAGTLAIDGTFDPYFGVGTEATVCLSGDKTNKTAIHGFSEMELHGVDFLSPEGGYYNSSKQRVCDADNNNWNGEVKIGVKDYGIEIGGVAVTSKNKDNITGSNISGNVRFESLDGVNFNRLYLKDVTIDNTQGYGIGNLASKPLFVDVEGECSVKGTHAIYSENNITLNGSSASTLNLTGTLSGVLVKDKKTLAINNVNVNASGATNSGCIRGGGHSKLSIDSSSLEVNSGSYPCVKGFDECRQDNTEVYWPDGVWFSRSLTGFGNASGLTTGKLELIQVRENYPVSVAGHRLNDVNSMNFCYENTSGYLEYSSESNLLVFVDFAADCEGEKGIMTMTGNELNILVEGDATFRNTDGVGIGSGISFLDDDVEPEEELDIYVDLNILGQGTLEMDGGIDIYGNLKITDEMTEDGEGPVVKATYIKGISRKNATVSNSRVFLEGDGSNSTIRGFNSFGGEDCVFAQPIGATYSGGKLWNKGQVVTGNVIVCTFDEYTAIGEASQDGDLKVDATYDIAGRRTNGRRSGIILQHMSDGTVRKQLVK